MSFFDEMKKKTIKSKVRFGSDFQKIMEEVLSELEDKVINEIGKTYKINYTALGSNDLKVKIKDDDHKIDKLIDCIFRYTQAEEKFGYVIVDIIVHEYSHKPKSNIIGKMLLSDKDKLTDTIIKKMFVLIEDIG